MRTKAGFCIFILAVLLTRQGSAEINLGEAMKYNREAETHMSLNQTSVCVAKLKNLN
jgi:hypothetical protein